VIKRELSRHTASPAEKSVKKRKNGPVSKQIPVFSTNTVQK